MLMDPYFGGGVGDHHILLSDIVELLLKLQLPGRGTCSENLFQIFPGLLWCFRISDVAQHLIVHTGCDAI